MNNTPKDYLYNIFEVLPIDKDKDNLYNCLSKTIKVGNAKALRMEIVHYITNVYNKENETKVSEEDINNIANDGFGSLREILFFSSITGRTVVNIRIDENFNITEFDVIFPSRRVKRVVRDIFPPNLKFFEQEVFKDSVFILMMENKDNYYWDSLTLKNNSRNVQKNITLKEGENKIFEDLKKKLVEDEKIKKKELDEINRKKLINEENDLKEYEKVKKKELDEINKNLEEIKKLEKINDEKKKVEEDKKLQKEMEEKIKKQNIENEEQNKRFENEKKKTKDEFPSLKFDLNNDYKKNYVYGGNLNNFLLSFSTKYKPSRFDYELNIKDNIIFSETEYKSYDNLIGNNFLKNIPFENNLELYNIIKYLISFYNECVLLAENKVNEISNYGIFIYDTNLANITKNRYYLNFYSLIFKKIKENTINYIEEGFLKYLSIIINKDDKYEIINKKIQDYRKKLQSEKISFDFITINNQFKWNSSIPEFISKYFENPDKYKKKEEDFKGVNFLSYIRTSKKIYDEEQKKIEKLEEENKRKIDEKNKLENEKRMQEDKKKEEEIKIKKIQEEKNIKSQENKKIEEENKEEKKIEIKDEFPTLKFDTKLDYINKGTYADINDFLLSFQLKYIPSTVKFQLSNPTAIIFKEDTYTNYDDLFVKNYEEKLYESYRVVGKIIDYIISFYNDCVLLTENKLSQHNYWSLNYIKYMKEMKVDEKYKPFYLVILKKIQENTINYMEEEFLKKITTEIVNKEDYKKIGEKFKEYAKEIINLNSKHFNLALFVKIGSSGWISKIIDFLQKYYRHPELYEYKVQDFKNVALLNYIKRKKSDKDYKDSNQRKDNLTKTYSSLVFNFEYDYQEKYVYDGNLNHFLLSFSKKYKPSIMEIPVNDIKDGFEVIFDDILYLNYDNYMINQKKYDEKGEKYVNVKEIIKYLIQFYNECAKIISSNIFNRDILDFENKVKNMKVGEKYKKFYLIFFKKIQENTINYIEEITLKSITRELYINENLYDYIKIGEYIKSLADKWHDLTFINKNWNSKLIEFLKNYYEHPTTYSYKEVDFQNQEYDLFDYIKEKKNIYDKNKV